MIRFLIYGLLLLSGLTSFSYAEVLVNEEQSYYNLGNHLTYFEETGAELFIDDILGITQTFQKAEGPSPNFGQVNSSYWFKIDINHTLTEHKLWLLELDFPYLDHIEFYLPDKNGRFQKFLTGDNYPFKQRQIQDKGFIFEISLQPQQATSIYFRVKTTTSLQVPVHLWDPKQFIEKTNKESAAFGIFYGVILIMGLYNFLIFLSIRDISYLYYTIYIGANLLASLSINGYAFQYLWPESPLLANSSIPIFLCCTLLSVCIFSRSFLKTWTFSILADRSLKLSTCLAVLALFAILVIDRSNSLKLAILLNAITSLLLLCISIYGTYKKQRRAYFFLAAWGTLFIGAIMRSMLQFDLLPSNFITFYSAQIGVLIEVFILSLALGDRINTEKTEKITAVETMLKISKQQVQTEQRQIYQSLHDPLTDCPNQIFCERLLEPLIEDKNENGDSVSVICIQLNNFNDINYTLGHETGDQILLQLISRLNTQIAPWPNILTLEKIDQKVKVIAKIEGVCLALFLTRQTHISTIKIIEQIHNIIHQAIHFKGMMLNIDAHMGISASPEHGNSTKTLIRKAMVAVKTAKRTNRLSVRYSKDIDNYSTEKLSLMGELNHAITNDELVLFYHPKIDLTTQKMVSMEALIRWNHPIKGLLGPDKFVDLAEGSGMIKPLTQWVIKNAILFCKEVLSLGYDINVAVNISARNLLEEDFVHAVNQLLIDYSFDPSYLTLEVVESALVEDYAQTISKLESLKHFGIKLSIDDFGTGYSSLAYLKRLPVDELKIDRSFVKDMLNNNEDQAIIETTINLAHRFNLNVVAEGIEDQGTLELLTQMNCDTAQGYFFTKPMPTGMLKDWLSSTSWKPDKHSPE